MVIFDDTPTPIVVRPILFFYSQSDTNIYITFQFYNHKKNNLESYIGDFLL